MGKIKYVVVRATKLHQIPADYIFVKQIGYLSPQSCPPLSLPHAAVPWLLAQKEGSKCSLHQYRTFPNGPVLVFQRCYIALLLFNFFGLLSSCL